MASVVAHFYCFLSCCLLLPSCRAVLVGEEVALQSKDDENGKCGLVGASPWNPGEKMLSIGVKGQEWLPVAYEIEVYYRHPDEEWTAMTQHVRDKFKVETSGECPDRMFAISPSSSDMATSWVMDKESPRADGTTMWEISSPYDLTEEETELSCRQTHMLSDFYKKPAESNPLPERRPGLHVHVGSKCLTKDASEERRLVALLLVWDKYFVAILVLTKSSLHAKEHKFAETIKKKNGALFDYLWDYVNETGFKAAKGVKSLTDKFVELEPQSGSPGDPHDGYRRFAANVCHLLDVKCGHHYPEKNQVKKFGALEFRGFDAALGELARFIIMIVQRFVQSFCHKSIEDLHKVLVAGDGDRKEPSNDVRRLLEFLGLKEIPSHPSTGEDHEKQDSLLEPSTHADASDAEEDF